MQRRVQGDAGVSPRPWSRASCSGRPLELRVGQGGPRGPLPSGAAGVTGELKHRQRRELCLSAGRRVGFVLTARVHLPLASFCTQSLTAKPGAPSRALEGKHAWVPAVQARAAQPRTKQTTIATFFSRRTGNLQQPGP